jgi:hypothetical protein
MLAKGSLTWPPDMDAHDMLLVATSDCHGQS